MEVERDPEKAASNRAKHGIEFEEAATCLLDPNALVIDEQTSQGEARWVLVGLSFRLNLLTVVYTLRNDEDRIRLISARKATKREAAHYA